MCSTKLIAFDYDGVLADSFDYNLNAFNTILKRNGLSINALPDDLKNLKNMTYEQLAFDVGVPQDMVESVKQETLFEMEKTTSSVSLYEGIVDMIKEITSKVRLAIISHTNSSTISTVLEHLGCDSCFSDILGGDIKGTKSQRLEFLMETYLLAPEDLYMVGDSMSDIMEAHKAGVYAIAAGYGFQSVELLQQAGADKIVGSVDELCEFLNDRVIM